MSHEREWQKWQKQELNLLYESIEWAYAAFETTDVEIDQVRHYGVQLLAHSIECARAIHLCISKDLPGSAFSLLRVQYEGALRGHIMVNEIDIEELSSFVDRVLHWRRNEQSQHPPPQIVIRKTEWKYRGTGTKSGWRPLQCEIAKRFAEAGRNMGFLHDLTHSGMTQALQMGDEDGCIRPSYSAMNQTLLLCFAQKTVMFAMMTWPGVTTKYWRENEQRAAEIAKRWSIMEPHIVIPTG